MKPSDSGNVPSQAVPQKYSLAFKIVVVILAIPIVLMVWGLIRNAESPEAAILAVIAVVGLAGPRLLKIRRMHKDPASAERTVGGKLMKSLRKDEHRDH